MTSILTIEHGLSEIRPHLAEMREAARRVAGYVQVVALHGNVTRTRRPDSEHRRGVDAIAGRRREARHATALALDQADTTLAAYKRALTTPSSAALFDRRG